MTDPRDSFDLTGRVAVITGAGSGIGAASSRMLAGVGATVVCADVNLESAARTADEDPRRRRQGHVGRRAT